MTLQQLVEGVYHVIMLLESCDCYYYHVPMHVLVLSVMSCDKVLVIMSGLHLGRAWKGGGG